MTVESAEKAIPAPAWGSAADSAVAGLRRWVISAGMHPLARVTPWVEGEVAGLRRWVGTGDTCIDVGAGFGCYTAALSRLVGGSGVVHSVEPLPSAYPLLSSLFRPRELRNVSRHGVALGSESGSVPMSVPLRRTRPVTERAFLALPGTSEGPNAEFDGELRLVVPTVTLDELCAAEGVDRLRFIKADVEGAELTLLQGGMRTIERHAPTLLLEIEDRHTARYGHTARDVAEWVMGLGYRMYRWDRRRWSPTGTVQPGVCNYLFASVERRPADDRTGA